MKPPSATAATHSTRRARNTTCATAADMASSWKRPAPTSSPSRTWLPAARGGPRPGRALREKVGLAHSLHTHDTGGGGVAGFPPPPRPGMDAADAAMDAMSGLTSQPSMGAIVAALERASAGTAAPGYRAHRPVLRLLGRRMPPLRPFEADLCAGSPDVHCHEMPGGQYTNLREQARAMASPPLERHRPGLRRDTNRLFMTSSRSRCRPVVGDLAPSWSPTTPSAADVADAGAGHRLPESVYRHDAGRTRFPADGFPGDPGRTCGAAPHHRPRRRPPARRRPRRRTPRRKGRRPPGRRRRSASYLMYPELPASTPVTSQLATSDPADAGVFPPPRRGRRNGCGYRPGEDAVRQLHGQTAADASGRSSFSSSWNTAPASADAGRRRRDDPFLRAGPRATPTSLPCSRRCRHGSGSAREKSRERQPSSRSKQ